MQNSVETRDSSKRTGCSWRGCITKRGARKSINKADQKAFYYHHEPTILTYFSDKILLPTGADSFLCCMPAPTPQHAADSESTVWRVVKGEPEMRETVLILQPHRESWISHLGAFAHPVPFHRNVFLYSSTRFLYCHPSLSSRNPSWPSPESQDSCGLAQASEHFQNGRFHPGLIFVCSFLTTKQLHQGKTMACSPRHESWRKSKLLQSGEQEMKGHLEETLERHRACGRPRVDFSSPLWREPWVVWT